MKPIIHSTKHTVQAPISQIATGIRENILIFRAQESTVANTATEVAEGAIVKAVFVEMWLQNQSNLGHSIVVLEKVPSGGTGASFTDMGNLFAYVNKKNILFTHEGLTANDAVGNPIPVIRQWFKIPKGKQRFGLGDRLTLTISNPSASDLNRCGMFIFKELD